MKSEQKDKREMHKATCADCGKECEVPFKPDEDRPVYCKDCFQKHRTPRKSTLTNKTEMKSPEPKPVVEPKPTVDEQSILLTKYQYLLADFENYRKQVSKEKENQSKFGNSQIIQHLIEIYEDLKRIVDNIDSNDSSLNGIKPVIKKIESMFKEQSVEIIPSVGTDFDPNIHEAVESTENSEFADNVIISEIQSGYKIHGQVLRPSKVNVSKHKVLDNGVNANE